MKMKKTSMTTTATSPWIPQRARRKTRSIGIPLARTSQQKRDGYSREETTSLHDSADSISVSDDRSHVHSGCLTPALAGHLQSKSEELSSAQNSNTKPLAKVGSYARGRFCWTRFCRALEVQPFPVSSDIATLFTIWGLSSRSPATMRHYLHAAQAMWRAAQPAWSDFNGPDAACVANSSSSILAAPAIKSLLESRQGTASASRTKRVSNGLCCHTCPSRSDRLWLHRNAESAPLQALPPSRHHLAGSMRTCRPNRNRQTPLPRSGVRSRAEMVQPKQAQLRAWCVSLYHVTYTKSLLTAHLHILTQAATADAPHAPDAPHIPDAPHVGQSFASEGDFREWYWRVVVPRLGVSVARLNGTPRFSWFNCNKQDCHYAVKLEKVDGQFVVASNSRLSHNHGAVAKLLDDPNWRPHRRSSAGSGKVSLG